MNRTLLLAVGAGVFLIAVGFGIFWAAKLRPAGQIATSSPTPPFAVAQQTSVPTQDVTTEGGISAWAEMMIKNYPYKKDSFSGVLPAKSKLEVWVIGFRGSSNNYPPQYEGVTNEYGEFYARLSESALFTRQVGDDPTDEKATVESATPQDIAAGNPVAMRMTFFSDFATILEVRRLQR